MRAHVFVCVLRSNVSFSFLIIFLICSKCSLSWLIFCFYEHENVVFNWWNGIDYVCVCICQRLRVSSRLESTVQRPCGSLCLRGTRIGWLNDFFYSIVRKTIKYSALSCVYIFFPVLFITEISEIHSAAIIHFDIRLIIRIINMKMRQYFVLRKFRHKQ